jgi:hypothetical protein
MACGAGSGWGGGALSLLRAALGFFFSVGFGAGGGVFFRSVKLGSTLGGGAPSRASSFTAGWNSWPLRARM